MILWRYLWEFYGTPAHFNFSYTVSEGDLGIFGVSEVTWVHFGPACHSSLLGAHVWLTWTRLNLVEPNSVLKWALSINYGTTLGPSTLLIFLESKVWIPNKNCISFNPCRRNVGNKCVYFGPLKYVRKGPHRWKPSSLHLRTQQWTLLGVKYCFNKGNDKEHFKEGSCGVVWLRSLNPSHPSTSDGHTIYFRQFYSKEIH